MWHMKCDMWYGTGGGDEHSLKIVAPSSYGWCFEGSEEKDDSKNDSMSDEGVCRTALATSGLLNTHFAGVIILTSWTYLLQIVGCNDLY